MFNKLSARKPLNRKSILTLLLMLLPCHAVVADTLLVWMAEERAGVRDVAPAAHPLASELRRQVASPVSVLSPLMDLTDQQAITADRLWQGDAQAVLAASARYAPDYIVLARMDAQGAEPFTEWLIWHQGNRQSLSTQGDWPVQAERLLAFVSELSDRVAAEPDQLTAPLALAPVMAPSGYLLTLYRLDQPADFLDAMAQLRELFGSQSIRPVSFNAGTLRVSIDYEGAISGLRGELQRHPRFNALPDGQLEFFWN